MALDPEKWCMKETWYDRFLTFISPFVFEKKVKLTYFQVTASSIFSFIYFYKAEGLEPFIRLFWFGALLIFFLLMLQLVVSCMEAYYKIQDMAIHYITNRWKKIIKRN